MAIVAGVDFGTLSVRVSIVDSERGLLASAIAEYPLHRKREDPDFASQSHEDHMHALAQATRQAVRSAGISGDELQSIALENRLPFVQLVQSAGANLLLQAEQFVQGGAIFATLARMSAAGRGCHFYFARSDISNGENL